MQLLRGWAFCIPVSGATLLSHSSLLHGGTVQDLRNCSSRALWRLCGLQSTSGLQGNSLTLTSKCLQYGMATAAWRTRIERRDAPTESNAQLPYCFNQAVARGEPKVWSNLPALEDKHFTARSSSKPSKETLLICGFVVGWEMAWCGQLCPSRGRFAASVFEKNRFRVSMTHSKFPCFL